MTCLVSVNFASAAAAICLAPQPFAHDLDVGLDFQIVEKASGQSMNGAFVRITNPFDSYSAPACALTDGDGRARLTGLFHCSGEKNAFVKFGVFNPWGRWLEVSAPKCLTVRVPLAQVLGADVALGKTHVRPVFLSKGKSPEDSFRKIAGCYSQRRGMGGEQFRIEPDGRFAWSAGGCTFHYQAYGYLKRNGESIELVAIANPGRELHPLMSQKFRAVEWGARMYFCADEVQELQELCRTSLTPSRPCNAGHYCYCRDSDAEKPLAGLPRLPAKVWATFVLDEIWPRDKDAGGVLPTSF
jgi:hypothetical protein